MITAYFLTTAGERVPIERDSVIGRTSDQDITLAAAEVSRRHAKLTIRTGAWWITDLGSRNGTFVNGQAIGTNAVCLADGDTIVFGGVVGVVFHDPAATPVAPRIGQLEGVWIDPDSAAVWVDATRVEPPLSPKQLALLQLLDEHRGDVVSRPTIVDTIWADVAAAGVSDDSVAALVKRLRARLREGPLHVDYVYVIKGRGVRLT